MANIWKPSEIELLYQNLHLTDKQISEKLQEQGYNRSKYAVSKYRSSNNILKTTVWTAEEKRLMNKYYNKCEKSVKYLAERLGKRELDIYNKAYYLGLTKKRNTIPWTHEERLELYNIYKANPLMSKEEIANELNNVFGNNRTKNAVVTQLHVHGLYYHPPVENVCKEEL